LEQGSDEECCRRVSKLAEEKLRAWFVPGNMNWEILVHPRIIRALSPLDCEMEKTIPWTVIPQEKTNGNSSVELIS
jgi:hypothetical protein